jgi:isopenicillin N synthase-like dioxygenase
VAGVEVEVEGAVAHVDRGVLTVIFSEQGGLQLRDATTGTWVDVSPVGVGPWRFDDEAMTVAACLPD